ncbi:MAG: WD40 repeat domain-containing protein, partial [Gemmataceae bacterium]
ALTVPFLDRHLQTPPVDPQQVRRWIADLDSDTFAVREAAQKELEQRGEIVAPALRQALRDKPSLEARKRMEHLLADMISRVPSGEYLASLRALTVLERIGTPAARRILEKIARRNHLDRRTRAAKAALHRLAARQAPKP